MKNLAQRDFLAGLLMVVLGAAFAFGSMQLKIGTLIKMGGGFFPLAIAVITILLGLAIALRGHLADRTTMAESAGLGAKTEGAAYGWRAPLAILTGVAMFAFSMKFFGFIPAVFTCVLISALADRSARLVETVILAGATAGACWVIFVIALQISAPAFMWNF